MDEQKPLEQNSEPVPTETPRASVYGDIPKQELPNTQQGPFVSPGPRISRLKIVLSILLILIAATAAAYYLY
jgi:hypothetical protein